MTLAIKSLGLIEVICDNPYVSVGAAYTCGSLLSDAAMSSSVGI